MQETNEQLYDIYTQWHIPFWQSKFFWVAVGAIGLLVVCIALVMFLRFIKSRKKVDPYHVIARKALEELRRSEYADPEHAAHFYATLITILKAYLSEHYQRDFSSKTDREVLPLLLSLATDHRVFQMTEHILAGSVAIRFAQASAIAHNMKEALDSASVVITLTQEKKAVV